ncbi:MAG: hypothetical protein ACJ74J_10310 [Blastocatellia bacterium]
MNCFRARTERYGLLCLLLLLVALISACSSRQERARKAVEENLKNNGVRELIVDYFHPANSMPDKAYIAVTVTYNQGTSSGEFQKEYLGYILKQDGQNWQVEKNTFYTKDKDRAESALAGGK